MKKKWTLLFVMIISWLVVTTPIYAQTAPRPTPTNVGSNPADARGSIFGSVYLDVNGDGSCINTGVEGELPVEGINIQFTSSDGATIIPLSTGPDGTFGLVAAGESNWEVLVVPDGEMVVTSNNPHFVPVYAAGTLIHSSIDFCIAKGANAVIVTQNRGGTTTQTNTVILAPEAGGAAKQSASVNGAAWIASLAGIGLLFVLLGLSVEWRRKV